VCTELSLTSLLGSLRALTSPSLDVKVLCLAPPPPGSSINSTCSVWKSRSGYCTLSGTSQAAPHVAGVFARCFSTGACSADQGLQNLQTGLDEFREYNTLLDTDYGFQQDPFRGPKNATKYYGFLVWAGAW
jgi:hypothetical protein